MHSDISLRIADPARLLAVAATGLPGRPVPEELSRLIRLAARGLNASCAAFLLLDGKGFRPRGSFALPEPLSGPDLWPADWAFLSRAAFEGITTVTLGGAETPAPGFPAASLPAFLGAPVEDGEGRILGVLAVWDASPREWTGDEKTSLGDFSALVRDLLAGFSALAGRDQTIRERARAEEDLASFRGEIDAMLKTLDTPIMAFSSAGAMVFANAAAASLLGYAHADDMLNAKPEGISARFDLLDESLRPYPLDRLPTRRALRGEVVSGELVCIRIKATGETKWTYVKATPVFDAQGKVRLAVTVNQDVTEIKSAQMELMRSRDELYVMLQTMDSACTAQDTKGNLVYANDAAARIMDFPDAETLMKTDPARILERFEILDEDGNPFPLADMPGRHALLGEAVASRIMCYRVKATGEERWSQVNAKPVFDDQGKVRLAINVFNDITEARRAEISVAGHLRYLEGMNKVSGAIEKTLDVERALPAAMARLLDVFDCDRAWLLPASDSAAGFQIAFSADRAREADSGSDPMVPSPETLPAEAGFETLALACKAAEDPVVFGRDLPMPNPEYWRRTLGVAYAKLISVRPQVGRPWILCLLRSPEASPWRSGDFALYKDVSSRVSTALGAMILHRDLKRSEEKFRTLFERSLDGIFRAAQDGALLDANPALVALLGYSDRGQMIGTMQPRLVPAGGEEQGFSDGGETFSVELTRKDGSPVWVEVNAQPIRKAGGGLAYFEGIVRNINDRKRAEEELKASEEKLRQSQKMEAVGRLAGGVAHDFNNLLTAINGFSDLLLMSFPKDDSRRNHLEEIRKAGGRAAALTSQLLSFSRKQVLAPRLLDVNAVVAGMETMLRRLIGEDIGFSSRLEPKLPKVVADPNQLEQVILNLVLNARDAMPEGGELLLITGARTLKEADDGGGFPEVPPGEYALLQVVDTGTGMDAETKSRLFEPFFTTKQKDKGTGLGLSTVYGAVKQSNGSITVESEPGKGTVFSIYLPAASKQDKPERARLRERALRSLGGTETILLVEDEDAVRRLVRDVLEVGGYRVLEAPGGEQALELMEKQAKDMRIHLLLTDVVMGGMSGRVLAEKLRVSRPETKVLFMSGYTEDAIIRHGVYTAQASFIGKPFSPAAISAKVREVLDAGEKEAAQASGAGTAGAEAAGAAALAADGAGPKAAGAKAAAETAGAGTAGA